MKHLINPDLKPRLLYEIYKDIKQSNKDIYNKLVKLTNTKNISKQHFRAVEKQSFTLNCIKQNIYNLLCDKLNNGKVIQEHLIKQKLEEYENNKRNS